MVLVSGVVIIYRNNNNIYYQDEIIAYDWVANKYIMRDDHAQVDPIDIISVRIWNSDPLIVRKNRMYKMRDWYLLQKYCREKRIYTITKDTIITDPQWYSVILLEEESEMKITGASINIDRFGDNTITCEYSLDNKDMVLMTSFDPSEFATKLMARMSMPKPERVIVNNKHTIVLWKDKTKTVVKMEEDEACDPEKAIMYCIFKKIFGNSTKMLKYLRNFKEMSTTYVDIKGE